MIALSIQITMDYPNQLNWICSVMKGKEHMYGDASHVVVGLKYQMWWGGSEYAH